MIRYKGMRLDLDNDDVIELLNILGDTYSELVLRHQLQKSGMNQPEFTPIDVTEELLFNCAKIMLTVNKQAHAAKLCNCPDDSTITLQEQVFNRMFKSRLETDRWWQEHIAGHEGFRVASPQSPTSYQPSQKDEAKWRPELSTPRGSVEEPKKKPRRTL